MYHAPRWFRPVVFAVLFVLAFGSMPGIAEAAVIRPFTPRFSLNTTGAITLTGNTLLTCPSTAAACLGARQGTGSSTINNNFSMVFVDRDSDATTFNSSRNTLSIPATSTVLWAGLYWGADTTSGGGAGVPAPNATLRDRVLFAPPGAAGYTTIIASQVDSSPVAGGFRYQGFADVTSLVTDGRSGEYTVANLQAGTGNNRYGGWALVVAIQDPNEPLRNLTVFDGYAVVQQTPTSDRNVAVPVSGFLTPPSGTVRSRVGVVAYEGDLGLTGDSLRLNSTPLTNSLNPATNFFNSSLTSFNGTITTGDPFYTNMLGFDVDTIRADGVLANGATSATINLNTTNDTYFPGVVSFSTELFSPRLDLAKSAVDLNGGVLDVGDEVLYTIQVTNNGADGAAAVVLSDVVPTYTTYVPNSIVVDGVPLTDAAGDDAAEIAAGPSRLVARLGTGASATSGGSIAIGSSRSVSFKVLVGTVPVDEIVANVAESTYIGATSGLALEAISNTVTLTPRPQSDLAILKYGPTTPVTVPGTVAYQLIVVNRGPAIEPAATVTDTLPPAFVIGSAVPSQGTCTPGATVTCDLGSLPVGATATIDIVGTVPAGTGLITNTATVAGTNLDVFPSNNEAHAVTSLNNAPDAIDQAATTPSGTPAFVNVLTGATDLDGDSITTVTAGSPSNGSTVVNLDNTVTYTPNPTFKGLDPFDFTVSDGRGGFDTATVSMTVDNGIPDAKDDFAATPPNTVIVVDVLDNDTDPNLDALSVTAITQPAGGLATGLVTFTAGDVTFAPDPAFRGTAVFTYTVSDGTDSDIATVSIEVPDQAPGAVDDYVDTDSGTPIDIFVLDNDIDPNLDPIFVEPASLTLPTAGGSAVLTGNTVTYTPPAGFKGLDTFMYTVSDGTLTSQATVFVNVKNAPPVAVDDPVTGEPDTPVEVFALSNDSDANLDTLTIIDVTPPSSGAAIINATGDITYTPFPGFKGDATFSYTVSDGTDSDTATVTVTVPNGVPRPANDTRVTEADTAVTVPVLLNDFDPNGDSLTVLSATAPTNGTTVVNLDGTVTYTPSAGFKGLDSFTYTVTDGEDPVTATVFVTVQNAPPVAADDAVTGLPDAPFTFDPRANDSDSNGDDLTVLTTTPPANGTVVINPDGTITYTPTPGFKGVDTFDYTVTDGTDTATATVTVTVPNGTPRPTDDAANLGAGTSVTIPVLANDLDPNGDTLTVTAVGTPANGTVTINPDGTITYTPTPGFKGVDMFTYTVSDGTDSATATVSVGVDNAAPTAGDDIATTPTGTAVTVSVLDNDADPNGDQLTVTAVGTPANGTVVINPDGTLTYTPTPGFSGVDIFTYTITDGVDAATATVSVGVDNAPPTASDDSATTASGTGVVIPVTANDTDPNGDVLTVLNVANPSNGTATINPDNTITYTPLPSFAGTETFTYTVTDGVDTDTATVTVGVTATLPTLASTGIEVGTLAATSILLIGAGIVILALFGRRGSRFRNENALS